MKVIITGASKGIGHGIAAVLGKTGHQLGLLARSEDKLEQVKEEIESAGGTAATAAGDVRSFQSTKDAMDRLIERLGGIDALVNNAGLIIRQSAMDISIEQWQDQIETNVNGVFYATRTVLPHLTEQGSGHIVNISSISGYMPLPGGSGYAASKFAVTGFSESLFQEVRGFGVKVTTIFPGSVDSASHRPEDQPQTWKVEPEEVGETVRHALETRKQNMVSRVELRPLGKPGK